MRQVFDDDSLLDEAMKLAQRLADGPTRALVATRALIEESEHASYAAQFRREIETAGRNPPQRGCAGRPQRVCGKAPGEVQRAVAFFAAAKSVFATLRLRRTRFGLPVWGGCATRSPRPSVAGLADRICNQPRYA